jgi:hypothetical protein
MAAFFLEDSITGECGVSATQKGGDIDYALLTPTRQNRYIFIVLK